MSESDRPTPDDSSDRTFNEEQKPLFESGDASDTRQRTPGTQSVPPSVPPSEPTAESGETPPGVSGVG